MPERVEYTFIKTDYRTVVSQLHRVDPGENDLEVLVGLCRDLQDPTLVYCRSPKRVRDVAGALLEGGVGTPRDEVRAAVEWVGAEYHPDWSFGVALAHGIGMHHGQLPRTLSQYVVKAFNDGHLRFLVCTSTLIEGVNTKAKNVVVLDNTIALRRYDFFTYNNIAGRSGRMFQYFIGHVYMFHDLPAQQLPLIDIPVFTQPDDAPEALLIQIDEQDLAAQARRKISDLLTQDDVDVKVLRESRGIDPRRLVTLSRAIREHANEWAADLGWTGQPTHQQLRRVCELIWEYLVPDRRRRAGVVSGPQLAFKIERFRQSRGAANLIRTALREDQDAPGDIVEATIEFLRFWANFNFPRYLLAVNRVQRDVFARMRRPVGNYAMFAGQVENWFLDPAIMALDEYGIPVQVGEKLQELLHPEGDLDVALARLRELQLDDLPLTAFERSLVEDAVTHL